MEYAYRYRADYEAVLWIDASSLATLVAACVNIVQLLQLPERDNQDQNSIVDAFIY
ncbi:MAG TPA: hypothetical protein VFV38_51085 [Ktedonobacteraceae bacterium]|nr:hypothetical protein [Ktedonobacteraceae bacterium]